MSRSNFSKPGAATEPQFVHVPTYLITLIVLLVLSACTLIDRSNNSPVNVHDQFAAKLTETQQAQTAALDLWDRVIFGEIVSCQEILTVPQPVNFSESDLRVHPNAPATQAQLNAAIQAIRNSADLWNIECADARAYVPLSMAKEGRSTALAANEPLEEAGRLLADW